MSHDKQRWQWVIQWLWAMLRGQLMTCLSDINLSTTHIVLTSLVSLCLYFLCANAMCSKTATRHFDVQSLTWPPKSPDLNPIDHMWDSLENRIRNCPVQPRTRKELQIALHEEWVHFPQYKIQRFIASMRKRCRACIAAREGHSRYWIVNLMKSNH